EEHEWAKMEDGNVVVIGITDYAQDSLGALVLVELPEEGSDVEAEDPFGVVESPKSVSDLFSPVTGIVHETNDNVVETPTLINDDPYGEGWLVKIKVDDSDALDNLMTADEYADFLSEIDDEDL
ncbi:MAG: glycine cleavage system protein GcvH, partial [Myxococcales bacterium]|nr:glycine cleavage system protein GcvH [Myxococcales bacterium]